MTTKISNRCSLVVALLFLSGCFHEPEPLYRCIDAERNTEMISITGEQMLVAAKGPISDEQLYAFFRDQRPPLDAITGISRDCVASLSGYGDLSECQKRRALLMDFSIRHLLNAINVLEDVNSEDASHLREFAIQILTAAKDESAELDSLPCTFSLEPE